MILNEAMEPVTSLGEAVRQESMERQADAILEIVRRFPSLKNSLRDLGSPSSSEARQAKKNLELALKDYIEGAKLGYKLFEDLQGGLAGRSLLAASRAAPQPVGLYFSNLCMRESSKKQKSDFRPLAPF